MKFEISDNSLDKISSDGLIIFVYQGAGKKSKYLPLESFKKIDKVLNNQLTNICNLEGFLGKRGEVLTVIPAKKMLYSRVYVVGLGKKSVFILDDLRRAVGNLTKKVRNKLDSLSFSVPLEINNNLFNVTKVICEGLLLGNYEFAKYKKEEVRDHVLSEVIISKPTDKKTVLRALEQARLYSEATILARDLINEPGSVATPTVLASIARDIAKKDQNIKCTILEKAQVEKMGMGAFLAVARGSDTSPKFIHLEYKPKRSVKRKMAIIGKGITFDSGGYDIKPGTSMVTMKIDMSGAAAVLGIFSVISKIQPNFNVMGIIAATPNLINGSAFLPDDIVKSYNGKTVEIISTDAEGRLALADCITYAVKQGATEIIDLATLTGACEVALGTDITGLFSNNSDLAKMVKASAFNEGEKVWELPLEKDYVKLSESSIADMTNVANTRYGGAITAALFLEEFVENKPWVHMDIAGPAFLKNGSDICTKGGSGFGVRTMLNLLKENKE